MMMTSEDSSSSDATSEINSHWTPYDYHNQPTHKFVFSFPRQQNGNELPYLRRAVLPMQDGSRLWRSFPKVLINLGQENVDEYFKRNIGRFDPNDCDEIVGTCHEVEKHFFRLTKKPDASEIRPPSVLKEAFMRLRIAAKDQSKYKYVCDQLRAIRQDLTVQKIRDKFTVEVYELNARLTLENKDLPEFNQCQSQLRQLYADLPDCENEYEFAAYRLLYYIYTENDQDILSLLNDLDQGAQESPFISFAISVHDALLKGYHIKLFKLYANTSFVMCRHLMDLFLDRERIKFMKIIKASYNSRISLNVLTNWFQFSSEKEFTEYMKSQGISLPTPAVPAASSKGQIKNEEPPKKNGICNGSLTKLNVELKKAYAETFKNEIQRNELQNKVDSLGEKNQELEKQFDISKKKLEDFTGYYTESSAKIQESQNSTNFPKLEKKNLKIQHREEPVPVVKKEVVKPAVPKLSAIEVQRLRAQNEIIQKIKATILKERCKRYIAIWRWATRKKREDRIIANFTTMFANRSDDAIAGISKVIKPVFGGPISAEDEKRIERIKERQIQSKYFNLWRKAIETRRCERATQKERLSFIYSQEFEMPNLLQLRQEQKKRAMEFSLFSSRKRPSMEPLTSECSSKRRKRFMTSTPIIGNVRLESPSFNL